MSDLIFKEECYFINNGEKIITSTKTFILDFEKKLHGNPSVEIFQEKNPKLKVKELHHNLGRLSRSDGPAKIIYDSKGKISQEEWFLDGAPFRKDNLPNIIIYHLDGKSIYMEKWTNNIGNPFRQNGPTTIIYSKNYKEYIWQNEKNLLHRLDGPAIIRYNKKTEIVKESFYIQGILKK